MSQQIQSAPGGRASFGNRISRLWSRRYEPQRTQGSNRASNACSVPIFMSPPPEDINQHHVHQDSNFSAARASPPSLLNDTADHHHSLARSVAASSVYSATPRHADNMETFEEQGHLEAADHSTEEIEETVSHTSYTNSDSQQLIDRRKRRRRVRESTRQKIHGKKRLSVVFGITVLATLITYVALAVTKVAQGLMFHLLSILFILALLGIFLHSTISLILLQKKRDARPARRVHAHWHRSGQRSGTSASTTTRSRSNASLNKEEDEEVILEKPMAVIIGGDEVVTTTPKGKNKKVIRLPPPVYGNFRESKRMNPEKVYWQQQEPSPTTPSYDEAMMDVQKAVGFQPPQYISPRRERNMPQTEPGQQRTSQIHPLERERLVGLMGNTMSSQRTRQGGVDYSVFQHRM